jgi:hypothetical protein
VTAPSFPQFDLAQYRQGLSIVILLSAGTGSWHREAVRPYREGKMTDFIELLRQEHRNFESLLRVLERELGVFGRGERPDYEVLRAVIDYFKDYPDSCHHPKDGVIGRQLVDS